MELNPEIRIAGVLAPVFAIRGSRDLGVGDTAAVAEFAGWAAKLGVRAVQILPVNETGADHSPYNAISSMAIDPLSITTDPDSIPELAESDFKGICNRFDLAALRSGSVRYPVVERLKRELTAAAFGNFIGNKPKFRARRTAFESFKSEHSDWLEVYTFFRALMDLNGGSEVVDFWPEEHRSLESARNWMEELDSDSLADFRAKMEFFAYVQWLAWSQWSALHDECGRLGVALIGDIPVGVSIYSCDVWEHPHLFDLSRSSGAPPEKVFKTDAFTEQWGQNWGFPLYDWQAMSHDNFAWWRRRLRGMLAMFDLIRIDHALGFFRIYSFPWRPSENDRYVDLSEDEARAQTGGALPAFVPQDDSTDENRDRNRRHGETLLRILLEETGPHRLIAEDLGAVAPYVRPVLAQLEIPGFKIPQWEPAPDGSLTPGSMFPRLSLATYATHDHPPFRAMWSDLYRKSRADDPAIASGAVHEMGNLLRFAGQNPPEPPDMPPFSPELQNAFLLALFKSESWLAIPMITDLLGLEDRFNIPGAIDIENWTLRVPGTPDELDRCFQSALTGVKSAIFQSGRAAA